MQALLILGLPKAGKTTFIAALWYVVETARVPGAMQLAKLPENRRHLNAIRERWVTCTEQKHTSVSSEREVRLELREPGGTETVELVVPDLSGESFEMQWSHRQWSRTYHELAASAAGALLFVHPDRITESPTISEATALSDLLVEPELSVASVVPSAAVRSDAGIPAVGGDVMTVNGDGSDLLAARSFEVLHRAAELDEIPYDAWQSFQSELPPLPWWQSWDYCERLRRGIVAIFIRYEWPSEGILACTNDSSMFAAILNSARDVKYGREFFAGLAERVRSRRAHVPEGLETVLLEQF